MPRRDGRDGRPDTSPDEEHTMRTCTWIGLAGAAMLGSLAAGDVTCLDNSYDGDADGTNEIRLASECETMTGFCWLWQKITHTIDSLSHTETYIVDYTSASWHQSPVKPWHIYLKTVETLKSCADDDKGAEFTRTGPSANPKVTAASAEACVPGWVVLDELKDLLSCVPADEPKELALHAALDRMDKDTGEQAALILTDSRVILDEDAGVYLYRTQIYNGHEQPIAVFLDAAPSPDDPQGWNALIEPGQVALRQYALPAFDPLHDPVEYTGRLQYLIEGEFDADNHMLVSTLVPRMLGPVTGACLLPDGTCATGTPEQCEAAQGTFLGAGVPCTTPCPGDVDGDGIVSVTDLLIILAAWGPNAGHPADLDFDGVVGVNDLLIVLGSWGAC
jgi:hypothetical protein